MLPVSGLLLRHSSMEATLCRIHGHGAGHRRGARRSQAENSPLYLTLADGAAVLARGVLLVLARHQHKDQFDEIADGTCMNPLRQSIVSKRAAKCSPVGLSTEVRGHS